MPETRLPAVKIRFDAFEFDFQVGELRRGGQRVKLQDQPSRVLFRLLQRPGEVVTREELREELWPADTYVDFDHGLNSAVARLRESLRDSADKPRFVETISKRGYRFIATIHTDQAPEPEPQPIATKQSGHSTEFPVSKRFWAVAVLLVTSSCAAAIWAMYRPDADKQLTKIEVVPIARFSSDPCPFSGRKSRRLPTERWISPCWHLRRSRGRRQIDPAQQQSR